MLRFFKICSIVILVFLFSCNRPNNEYDQKMLNYLLNFNDSNKLKNSYNLVVPQNSCNSCLDFIYSALTEVNTNNFTIIIVNATSSDLLNVKNYLKAYNIKTDKKRIFYTKKNKILITNNPIFIKIKNNKITNRIEFKYKMKEKQVSNMIDIIKVGT